MARGLTRADAERLIVRGFFQDVLDRIELAPVREALAERARSAHPAELALSVAAAPRKQSAPVALGRHRVARRGRVCGHSGEAAEDRADALEAVAAEARPAPGRRAPRPALRPRSCSRSRAPRRRGTRPRRCTASAQSRRVCCGSVLRRGRRRPARTTGSRSRPSPARSCRHQLAVRCPVEARRA